MKSFHIQQKIRPLVNQYVIHSDSEGGEVVAFAQQKRLALKEKITFYSDESKKDIVFEVKAQQVMEFGARYEVIDPAGNILGVVGKNFKESLLRSTWSIYKSDSKEPIIVASERSGAIAIIRRIWGFIPIVNEIPFFVKYHFDFKVTGSDKVVASYEKTAVVRDRYRLDIHDEAILNEIDWRVFVSLGVMMDALQSR